MLDNLLTNFNMFENIQSTQNYHSSLNNLHEAGTFHTIFLKLPNKCAHLKFYEWITRLMAKCNSLMAWCESKHEAQIYILTHNTSSIIM